MRFSWLLLPLLFIILPFLLVGGEIEALIARRVAEGPGWPAIGLAVAGALAVDPLLPIPSSLVATLAGARLGFWGGTIANAIGLSLAVPIGLMIGRAGRAALPAWLTPTHRVRRWLDRHALAAVLICRPVPVLAEASLIIVGAAGRSSWRLLLMLVPVNLCLGSLYAGAGALAGGSDAPVAWLGAGTVAIPALFTLLAMRLSLRA